MQLRGVVVDGYLEGATVFVDLNGDSQHDADEPSVETNGNGEFQITVEGSEQDLAKLFVHAIVPDTAKDSDDLGATLKQAGKSGFTLLAPVTSVARADAGADSHTVVSPLSALVASEMLSTGLDVSEANDAVQRKLGLTGKDLLQDFVTSPDATLHAIAQIAAVSLGEASSAAAGDAGVSGDQGDRALAALASVADKLPMVVAALNLNAGGAPPSPEAVKMEWARVRDMAVADAAVPLPFDPGMVGIGADAGWLPPVTGSPMNDAGVRLPPALEALLDGAVPFYPSEPRDGGASTPPPADEKPDAAVRPSEPQDAGVKPPYVDAKPDAGSTLPPPPRDAGVKPGEAEPERPDAGAGSESEE